MLLLLMLHDNPDIRTTNTKNQCKAHVNLCLSVQSPSVNTKDQTSGERRQLGIIHVAVRRCICRHFLATRTSKHSAITHRHQHALHTMLLAPPTHTKMETACAYPLAYGDGGWFHSMLCLVIPQNLVSCCRDDDDVVLEQNENPDIMTNSKMQMHRILVGTPLCVSV